MKSFALGIIVAGLAWSTQASAAEISTHVLDLATGLGGSNVPVVLMKRAADKSWTKVATATTDGNGRVKGFQADKNAQFPGGVYKLVFDMDAYRGKEADAFFPEINVVFKVDDKTPHYHVPVVVSPFGYSTYRGN